MPEISTSNHEKYVSGRDNPVVAAMMDRLTATVARRIRQFAPTSMLDAGCGEGHALHGIVGGDVRRYTGIDANPACIEWCRLHYPNGESASREFTVGSVLALPFGGQTFDVVLCMEVLEHLAEPKLALAELVRVADRAVVLSVPFEPVFQAGNLARGKYLPTLGNHPEHCQHWGFRSFPRWLRATGLLTQIEVEVAGPWLVASGRPNR